MTERPKAFVIMPFDDEFDSIYEDLIKQSLTVAGYEVSRADSLMSQQNILQDIISGIASADLVVADLTATNPNVFYELGLCHAMDIPTILIAQSMSDVPFDLRSYRIHIYETRFDRIKKLKDFLKRIGEDHRRGEIVFRNPVTDFSQGRVTVATAVPSEATPGNEEAPQDSTAGKEWLDYLTDAEMAMEELNATLQGLVGDTQSINEKIRRHSAAIELLANNPSAGSARRFHKLALLAASDITSFSRGVENRLQPLEEVIQRVDTNYVGVIQTIAAADNEKDEKLRQLDTALSALLSNSKEAKKGIHVFRDAAIGLAERKISKDLSRASRLLAETLTSVISKIERIEAFCLNARTRIEQRLDDKLVS